MKRVRMVNKSIKHTDMTFDDLFNEISRDWQHKAEVLQARRWRAINNSYKGVKH